MDQPPKPAADRRLWEFRAVRDLAWIAGIAGLVVLGAQLELITVPLLMALLLAYLIDPLLGWLQARHRLLTRGRALALVVSAMLLTAALALALVVPPTLRQAAGFAHDTNRHFATARAWLTDAKRPEWLRERTEGLVRMLPATLVRAPAKAEPAAPPADAPAAAPAALDEARVRALVREELDAHDRQAASSDLGRRLGQAGLSVAAMLASLLGGLVQVAISLVVFAFGFITCSLHLPRILAFIREHLPQARRARILDLAGRMDTVVAAFVRGRLLVAGCVGLLYAVGWTIVGVPYGFALGLFVGACSIVPYLAALGLPLAWALVAVEAVGAAPGSSWYVAADPATGAAAVVWWKVLVLPWVVNFAAQTIEDYVLTPLIQGEATGLHPLAIMVSVFAGGMIAGIYGMLLAVPAAACLRILAEEVLLPRLRGPAADPAAGPPPA